jgi:hypothetical protein
MWVKARGALVIETISVLTWVSNICAIGLGTALRKQSQCVAAATLSRKEAHFAASGSKWRH